LSFFRSTSKAAASAKAFSFRVSRQLAFKLFVFFSLLLKLGFICGAIVILIDESLLPLSDLLRIESFATTIFP
jgi:hypothetical protein